MRNCERSPGLNDCSPSAVAQARDSMVQALALSSTPSKEEDAITQAKLVNDAMTLALATGGTTGEAKDEAKDEANDEANDEAKDEAKDAPKTETFSWYKIPAGRLAGIAAARTNGTRSHR